MKILLVFTELNQKFGALRSQHGLAFLSAVLKKNGYPDVRLSYFAGILDLHQWEEDLRRIRPDLIGFYSTAEQFHFIKKLIEAVPRPIFTICGGPHPSCYPICIESIPRLDAICVGEGNTPFGIGPGVRARPGLHPDKKPLGSSEWGYYQEPDPSFYP